MAAIGRKNVDLYAFNAQYADQIQHAELGETKTGQVDLGMDEGNQKFKVD